MPVIEACVEAAEFWSNKIRVQYRGKDDGKDQMGFCLNLKLLLQGIQAYVKENHVTGLTWTPRGAWLTQLPFICGIRLL